MWATEWFMKYQIEQLEEENKKLKLIQETNEKQIQNDIKERDEFREENKNLKSDLAYERTMLDNVRAEYKSLQNVIKKLKDRINELIWKIDQLEEENENLRKDLFHLTNNGKSK